MKSVILFILIGLVALFGFNISGLRKELMAAREYARQMEERNSQLQRELMRLSRINSENKRFLDELEQSIKEFENKLPFSSLEKYIPKPILNDVKPIIEKLQVFQKTREGGILSDEEKVINSFLEEAE
jgi:polyhydroxyalkanoate synthesis regulator phasin